MDFGGHSKQYGDGWNIINNEGVWIRRIPEEPNMKDHVFKLIERNSVLVAPLTSIL